MTLLGEPLGEPVTEPDSRTRILDAAARLLVDNGVSHTSMRLIAAEVGIKAGSLYHHFSSKNEIVEAVLGQGIDVMEAAFDAAAKLDLPDPEARLRAHVRAHLSALFEHGPYTATHVVAFHYTPTTVRAAVVSRRDHYEKRWADLLAELQGEGHIDPGVHLGIARLALFGAMNATVEWFDPTGPMSLDELADHLAETHWRGISQTAAKLPPSTT